MFAMSEGQRSRKSLKNDLFPESVLESIIDRAIKEGKLFELLFTENGRRLWATWEEDTVKKLVREKLKGGKP